MQAKYNQRPGNKEQPEGRGERGNGGNKGKVKSRNLYKRPMDKDKRVED